MKIDWFERAKRRLFVRYVVIQRAGIVGDGREMARFEYFSHASALRFANLANMSTSYTYSKVEPSTRLGGVVKFSTTVHVPTVLIGALVGALVIAAGNWLLGDFEPDDITLITGFLGGQATCLWVISRNRDRKPTGESA